MMMTAASRPKIIHRTVVLFRQATTNHISRNNNVRVVALTPKQQMRYKSATTTVEHHGSTSNSSSSSSSSSSSVPIVQSLLAALLGCGTVSAMAALVENITAVMSPAGVPTFDSNGQRYDQSNFIGRFARMLLACDPKLILYTEQQIREAQRLIQQHDQNNHHQQRNAQQYSNHNNTSPSSVSNQNRILWEAKRIVDAAIHPDTNEIIPRPFRMSGYVPYNGPICVAMVASQSTMPLLFWSWVNQSQNALVNYYNRNASSPMSNETLATSYGAAVGSALLVAFGLATAIQHKFQPAQARHLLRWVAFPSAVVASSLNCYIVRSPEITTGIPLQNEQGDIVLPGRTSSVAATRAVHDTTMSRALLQAPVYFVPPLLLSMGPIRQYISHHPSMSVPITTFLLMVCFGIGLPATVAIFPQMSTIQSNQVESTFQQVKDPTTQQPYRVFYYNKGL